MVIRKEETEEKQEKLSHRSFLLVLIKKTIHQRGSASIHPADWGHDK